jgi:hypothetical protein
MQVNPKILKALQLATGRYGKTTIACGCGLDHNVPGLLLSGKRTGFEWDTWERVWQVLVEKGGLDPNDIECLPLSKRGTPAGHAGLSPEALDLSIRWMRLPRPQREKVSSLLAQCDGKSEDPIPGPGRKRPLKVATLDPDFKHKEPQRVRKTINSIFAAS